MSLLEELRSLEAIADITRDRKILIVYSEGKEYWPHFRRMLREIVFTHQCPFIFVSSSKDDPGLNIKHPLVKVFYIGKGATRVDFFKNLDAEILVLTMPDLGRLSLSRSPNCKNYVYVFHSPVSTHMVYREGAFDHYDTIFCVGPHHEAEIRAREETLGLPAKKLFRHGYERFDELISARETHPTRRSTSERVRVLLAPSWGASGLLETIGTDTVQTLLDRGCEVVVRPHPQTLRLSPKAIEDLTGRFGSDDRFSIESDMASTASFFESDVMVSDWSGAALEFAFTRLRPVIFIDTPRKANNPNWQLLGMEPIEAGLRDRIGIVVAPDDREGLGAAVAQVVAHPEDFSSRIEAERDGLIFNEGRAGPVAAAELARLAYEASLEDEGRSQQLDLRCEVFALNELRRADTRTCGGSLAAFLEGVVRSTPDLKQEDIRRLDALCRHIDVSRKLHSSYDADFMRPHPESGPADPAVFPLLALALVRAATRRKNLKPGQDLKFLNSAGNVLDAYERLGSARGIVAFESLLARATSELTGASA